MALYELDGAAPQLAADGQCWVAPSAVLIGNVMVARDASVWWGSVVRADSERIEIGEGSNIQDNCTMHTDPGFVLKVGRGVTVGHMAMVHGCEIGDFAMVGMGATVLNGARIGARSIVGANALVAEGKEIPEGVLAVGSPARIVRDLTADEIAHLETVGQTYIRKWRRYAAGLRAL
ncbi:MAG: gamma carbonic anhydrase family protein [Rhodobiaceae bacterium]|nr:gamma carbonic anhydrase family protein [Rhodobiaceae bacterium]